MEEDSGGDGQQDGEGTPQSPQSDEVYARGSRGGAEDGHGACGRGAQEEHSQAHRGGRGF